MNVSEGHTPTKIEYQCYMNVIGRTYLYKGDHMYEFSHTTLVKIITFMISRVSIVT